MILECDKNLVFKEDEHKYTYQGEELVSVTTFIKELFEDFDEDKWSKITAKKRGITQEEVLKEWADKRDLSCDFGTKIHEYAENIVNGKQNIKTKDEREINYRHSVDNYFATHLRLKPVVAELKLCLPEAKLAGTVDLIMQTQDEKKVFLYDYKTNKRIDQRNYYGNKCKRFDYLDDCNFIKYSFQLNIYAYIIKKAYNIDFDGFYLIHLTEKGWKELKCIDLSKEVEEIIQQRIKENEKQKTN